MSGICSSSGFIHGCRVVTWGFIYSFNMCLEPSRKVLSTSLSFSHQRKDVTFYILRSWKDRCPVTHLSHGHLGFLFFFFYPQGNEIFRNPGTLIESSIWTQTLINEKRWISSYLLPKEEQVHLWQLSLLPGTPSSCRDTPQLVIWGDSKMPL